MKIDNLIGRKFGTLTVLSRDPNKNGCPAWKCKCECGTVKSIRGCHLRNGHTKTCGNTWHRYGKKHHSWKGHEEISQRFFKSIQYNSIARKLEFSISIEYVWNLFLKQSRKCALSGLEIRFGKNNKKIKGTASLDRIDSKMGYVEGNVQWVHADINSMKWDMTQDRFLILCEEVHKHQKTINR